MFKRSSPPQDILAAALSRYRNALWGVGLASALVNILALTGSIFMMQVYDRVIPSRSVPTLVGLGVIAVALFVFQGLLDLLRARVLSRIGTFLEGDLARQTLDAALRSPLKAKVQGDGLGSVRDLEQIKGFLAGQGPSAFFDLPWIPLYLAICFSFHLSIGLTALAGAIVLIVMTVLTDRLSRKPTAALSQLVSLRNAQAEAARRSAEVLDAMGFRDRMAARWETVGNEQRRAQLVASDVTGGLGAVSKLARTILQSGLLAVGAYLVIKGEASGGVMFASSMMMSRALAPVELAIANWRGFLSAQGAWRRLRDLNALLPVPAAPMPMPPPSRSLAVTALAVSPPGERRLVVDGVAFELKAGQALGVIGPSASGKSSLARALVGVWAPVRGEVRLDGALHEQWSSQARGAFQGYLPQDVELLDGTIAENIARFDPEARPEQVLAAAEAAGVHELILRLPEGYQTRIGAADVQLSGGQRQRIGLARALYGDPFLVVLDEPNSNLDAAGEEALGRAIVGVRRRGGLVVVVAHRPSALGAVDAVLAMAEGRMAAFGPRDEVLAKVLRPGKSLPEKTQ